MKLIKFAVVGVVLAVAQMDILIFGSILGVERVAEYSQLKGEYWAKLRSYLAGFLPRPREATEEEKRFRLFLLGLGLGLLLGLMVFYPVGYLSRGLPVFPK